MSKTPKGSGHSAPNEDMKKKFREALDRKHAHGAATNATQQLFRRKSGG